MSLLKTKLLIIVLVLVLCMSGSVFAFAYNNAHAFDNADSVCDLTNKRTIPVIMYHSILKNGKSDYIVTPEIFENDIKELKKLGYTTVFPSEVIAFADNMGDLPKKPIIITFDDGHYNNLFYGHPILKKYDCKAIINIVGAYSAFTSESGDHSKPEYSHLTWEQIACTKNDNVFEIGNHTFNMHKFKPRFGISQKNGESTEIYCEKLCADVMLLQNTLKDKCGITPACFAYPFGKFNKTAIECLKSMGFRMLFTCSEGVNYITKGEPAPLYKMKRFNRYPKLSSKAFFAKF